MSTVLLFVHDFNIIGYMSFNFYMEHFFLLLRTPVEFQDLSCLFALCCEFVLFLNGVGSMFNSSIFPFRSFAYSARISRRAYIYRSKDLTDFH